MHAIDDDAFELHERRQSVDDLVDPILDVDDRLVRIGVQLEDDLNHGLPGARCNDLGNDASSVSFIDVRTRTVHDDSQCEHALLQGLATTIQSGQPATASIEFLDQQDLLLVDGRIE